MARQKSFTVHLPPQRIGRDPDDGIEFVPDTFQILAFVVPWFYFLKNRMWVETAGYVALSGLLFAAFWALDIPDVFRTPMALVINALFGLEAVTLQRMALARRGYTEAAVIVALSREEAERRWFTERNLAAQPRPSTPLATMPPMPTPATGVIGLFPEAQVRPRGSL